MTKYYIILLLLASIYACETKKYNGTKEVILDAEVQNEKHRSQFHFTPDSMWMNDPNGMVFHNGVYHLFYQYYPDSTIWGPMHWGHAASSNMVTWEHQPVALYPDEHGYIFSGSAVVDKNNTTGFGTLENPPLVAIYTYHNPRAESKSEVESQGIAYSTDNGNTWVKYDKNPVLKSPGIADFRDPKVRWHEETSKWIMTLAVKDHINFYSSPDLKTWSLESEFGHEVGAHGGVWECPDLITMKVAGSDKIYWVLIVSINPGGPNGGSATQYFVGDFDGTVFIPMDEAIRWIDYGPDNYAGVTWSNTGDRTLFIGWMSNWKYANIVPTERWRSAMTLPRELKLIKLEDELVVSSMPVPEFDELEKKKFEIPEFEVKGKFNLSKEIDFHSATFELDFKVQASDNFEIQLSNVQQNSLTISFDKAANKFVIDRSKTGDTSFHNEFSNIVEVPKFISENEMDLKLVVDVASLEFFVDNGSAVSTVIFFPDEVLDVISFKCDKALKIEDLMLMEVL